jgi:all-trans-retinol 13,14-reductase
MAGTLCKGGSLYNYLNFVGVLDHLQLVPYRRDCGTLLRFTESGDICIPQGTRNIVQTLSALYPEYCEHIAAFFADMETAYRETSLTDPSVLSLNDFGLKHGKRLSAYFDGLDLPAGLRTLMTMRSLYYGVPPGRCLFAEYALVAYSMQEDVHGFAGGGLSLVRAFEKELAGTGCSVRLGCKAAAVKTDSGGALAAIVNAEGEEFACDFCIYTGHPSLLPELLPVKALRASMRRYLARLEETHKIFIVFASTKSSFLHGRDAILCTSEDIDEAYEQDAAWLHITCGTMGKDGSYPVSISLNPGKKNGSWAKIGDYREWKKYVTAVALGQVARYMPELSDLTVLDSVSEYSMIKWVSGSRGSAYGVMHSADNMPVTPFTHMRGFLLAGQSILLPGLLGTCISAVVACGSLIGYKKLFRDIAWKSVA